VGTVSFGKQRACEHVYQSTRKDGSRGLFSQLVLLVVCYFTLALLGELGENQLI